MRIAWLILLISAVTDFVITAATALVTAMIATGSGVLPTRATVLVCVLGGFIQFSRTIQQALKATPENTAALRGDVSVTSTTTTAKTP